MHDEVKGYKGNNLQLCGWCTFEECILRKAKFITWFFYDTPPLNSLQEDAKVLLYYQCEMLLLNAKFRYGHKLFLLVINAISQAYKNS